MEFKTPPRRRVPGLGPKPTVGQPPSSLSSTTPGLPTAQTPSNSPSEPSVFKKPDEITTTDVSSDTETTAKEDLHIAAPKKQSSKRKLFILIILIFVLLGAIAAGYWFVFKPKKATDTSTPVATQTEAKEVTVTKITSPLTGVELSDASLAKRPVTGIMIENSPDARPQSGLTDAGIVYEAIAEGGITRFLAVYQDTKPNYIGPVRSARPYYVDFIAQYDAGYAHVGGSPEALSDIKSLGIKDLDQFYNGNYYTRITERYAPHNVYTGFDKLDALNVSKGYTSSKFTPFNRKPDVPQTPTAKTIDFSISSPLYSPEFVYDATTNTYKRFQGGEAHIDQKTKAQIAPKVVVALVMDKSYDPDGYHTDYKTVGSGKMYVFQDGIVSEGTWQKSDSKAPLVLTDKNGFPMKLNAGQTWISVVANQTDVTYKP